MLMGATNLRKHLEEKGILDKAFTLHPNYSFIITGIYLKFYIFQIVYPVIK